MRTAECWAFFFFFQAEDGIRDVAVTGVQTCALPISRDRERPDHGGYHLRGGSDARAPRPYHADRARRLYPCARHPAARECCVPRAARAGPALGRADRGARGPTAREARPRVCALRPVA